MAAPRSVVKIKMPWVEPSEVHPHGVVKIKNISHLYEVYFWCNSRYPREYWFALDNLVRDALEAKYDSIELSRMHIADDNEVYFMHAHQRIGREPAWELLSPQEMTKENIESVRMIRASFEMDKLLRKK
jgi:hypothetical protein